MTIRWPGDEFPIFTSDNTFQGCGQTAAPVDRFGFSGHWGSILLNHLVSTIEKDAEKDGPLPLVAAR